MHFGGLTVEELSGLMSGALGLGRYDPASHPPLLVWMVTVLIVTAALTVATLVFS